MDIQQRPAHPANNGHQTSNASSHRSRRGFLKFVKLSSIILLFSATILVVALLLLFVFGGDGRREERFVEKDKYQAVFMNGGQVYFGKITELNREYLTLRDIYYLQVDQQVQPKTEGQASDNITLVKLGCELHGPQDLMVVKQDQVIFWENLKDDGKVVQAVKQFKSQNPNGLQCSDQQQSTNTDN